MDIVKKNIVSVICGVIALIAIIASFFPLGGYAADLQANLDKSKSVNSSLSSLMTKGRNLPVLSPDSTEAKQLGTFPNEEIIEKGKGVVTEVKAQSEKMRDTAVQMNQRPLLLPGSFPSPSASMRIAFPQAYLPALMSEQIGQLPGIAKRMQAGTPPDPAEVTQRLQEEEQNIITTRLVKLPTGQVANQPEVDQLLTETRVKLPEEMRRSVAEKSKVYVNRDTFDVNQKILASRGKQPEVFDMFWAQVGLWAQDDVANAIIEANAKAQNILDAPVKHLIKITVPPQFVTGATGNQPAAAPTSPDAALTPNGLYSPTGRVSNGLYDVLHFTVNVIVAEDQLAEFVRVLGNNRFITVTSMDVRAVDNATAMAGGHYYGDKPVVNATMQCELLLMRKWLEPLMPDIIKQMLGITAVADPAAAAAAPQ